MFYSLQFASAKMLSAAQRHPIWNLFLEIN